MKISSVSRCVAYTVRFLPFCRCLSVFLIVVSYELYLYGLLKRVNRKPYYKLLTNIYDQFAFNIDVYPKTFHTSYELLEHHSKHKHQYRDWNNTRTREDRQSVRGRKRAQNHQNNVTELQYAQNTKILAWLDGRTIPRINCYKCDKYGHYANNCPDIITGEKHAITTDEYDNDGDDDSLIKSFQFHQ